MLVPGTTSGHLFLLFASYLCIMKEKNNPVFPKAGDTYEIPVEGSLGLFALGYRGLLAWRKKREEVKSEILKKQAEQDEQQNG
jgi:hypothetical protein